MIIGFTVTPVRLDGAPPVSKLVPAQDPAFEDHLSVEELPVVIDVGVK